MTRLPRTLLRAPSRAGRRSFAALMVLLLAIGGWALVSSGAGVDPSASAQTPGPDTPTNEASRPSNTHPRPGSSPGRSKPGPLARLAAHGEPIYCGAGTRPLVALTFDDGPGILTPEALQTLHRTSTPATFFLVGKLLAEPAFIDIAKGAAAARMAFGDHTWDHVAVTKGNAHVYASQIARTRRVITRITGQPVRLFRPPYGDRDAALDRYVRSKGMLQIMWSIDSRDSQGASVKQIVQIVRKNLSPGDIIVMHDNRSTTENALPRILDLIRARGLEPVTVPDLLRLDPPSARQLRSHSCG